MVRFSNHPIEIRTHTHTAKVGDDRIDECNTKAVKYEVYRSHVTFVRLWSRRRCPAFRQGARGVMMQG